MLEMRKKQVFILILSVLVSLPLAAQSQYLLTAYTYSVQSVCNSHGLTYVSTVWSNPNYNYGLYLVTTASSANPSTVMQQVSSDSQVMAFEQNSKQLVAEVSGTTSATVTQSTTSFLDALTQRSLVSFFGATVPVNYTQQQALNIIRLPDARTATGFTGTGVVAIIDTGVDPHHAALSGVLLPGYDFVRNVSGANELADLNPNIAASIAQSTTSFLDAKNAAQLVNFSLVALDQSTTSFLDGHVPHAFGHGTMTAGLVHVIAPTAKIMPLKAFNGDGNADLSSIVRAIYYAADHGANVISMSFEIAQSSPALRNAVTYAQSKGIVLVAAAGNDDFSTPVFPASLPNVFGIGATSNADARSTFSNFDPATTCTNVMFAAPGEGVLTTYPGNHYAAGWGTSFSAPLVAGAAALLLQQNPQIQLEDIVKALWKALKIPNMGHGRIDLFQALSSSDGHGGDDGSCGSSSDSGMGD
jgi:subtilisin family serine protease